MRARRRGLLVILITLFLSGVLSLDKITDALGLGGPVSVSEQSKIHILHGDDQGGGHQFGAGKPCKSEFPKEWSGDDIIANVEYIAANDNLPWHKQKNGYYTTEETVEGVRIRVVLNGRRDDVVTAYPLNTGRNACPRRAPANDNTHYNE